MSRNMRPVKIEWCEQSTSLFIEPEDFSGLVDAIFVSLKRKQPNHQYLYNDANDVYEFWTEDGKKFLKAIVNCNIERVAAQFSAVDKESVQCLVNNMKAFVPDWKAFVKDDGSFTLWLDM